MQEHTEILVPCLLTKSERGYRISSLPLSIFIISKTRSDAHKMFDQAVDTLFIGWGKEGILGDNLKKRRIEFTSVGGRRGPKHLTPYIALGRHDAKRFFAINNVV